MLRAVPVTIAIVPPESRTVMVIGTLSVERTM